MAYERVLAAADGRVLRAEWYEPECYDDQPTCLYGLMIEIEHDIDGNNTTDYITLYGHLSATAVTAGEKVVAGQVIGTSGKTGNITGAHLHFQVMLSNRRAVDPYGWNAPAGTPDPWSTHANGAVSWCMWINAGSACTPPTLAPPPEYETITIDHPNWAFTIPKGVPGEELVAGR
ncbi:MAG: M23 family metallopeptidase [Chloroflexi bacterium]|nr:M23 family metallopeptidase [Ardenticatenaceae bacterium]NOG34643.1 M23 family metallopeptidase [Chloroflexota bacterium]